MNNLLSYRNLYLYIQCAKLIGCPRYIVKLTSASLSLLSGMPIRHFRSMSVPSETISPLYASHTIQVAKSDAVIRSPDRRLICAPHMSFSKLESEV